MDKIPLNTPLCCNFKCECTLTDAIAVVSTHLSRTRKLLDETPTGNDRTPTLSNCLKILKSIQESIDELKRQNVEHLKFRSEYARELVEHVKVMQINAFPMSQVGLQSLPYLTGKAREAEKEQQAKKKRSKKKKQKKE